MTITKKYDRALIVGRALGPGGLARAPGPASGVEENQGDPYFMQPGVAPQLRMPADPGINLRGWINPYRMTSYRVDVPTDAPKQALAGNLKRTYLLIQNMGPGNLYLGFGSDASLTQSHVLVTTQFYEQIGGGGYEYSRRHSLPNAFVARDYVSVLADAAGTFAIVSEGTWNFVQDEVVETMRG